jgi:repressor protein|nr:MAG TPA: Cro/C1-type HTH DNA-binding domain protein [Caudoviricetes sp.]
MWDKIENQLKLRDWSMYRLSKESGVHQSNFSNLKAGRLKEMSWTNMCKIADALKVSLDEFRQKGEFYMPDITNGREKINAFLKEKGIKKTTLAVAYGFKRQEVTNILSGTTKGPRANSFILQVIEDYGIE